MENIDNTLASSVHNGTNTSEVIISQKQSNQSESPSIANEHNTEEVLHRSITPTDSVPESTPVKKYPNSRLHRKEKTPAAVAPTTSNSEKDVVATSNDEKNGTTVTVNTDSRRSNKRRSVATVKDGTTSVYTSTTTSNYSSGVNGSAVAQDNIGIMLCHLHIFFPSI